MNQVNVLFFFLSQDILFEEKVSTTCFDYYELTLKVRKIKSAL